MFTLILALSKKKFDEAIVMFGMIFDLVIVLLVLLTLESIFG